MIFNISIEKYKIRPKINTKTNSDTHFKPKYIQNFDKNKPKLATNSVEWVEKLDNLSLIRNKIK